MSNRDVHAACKRGETVPSTKFQHLLGAVGEFDNISALGDGGTMQVLRDSSPVKMMFVRNASGGALLPGQIVTWITGYAGKRVTNPAAAATAIAVGVVDHLLPAAGVPDGYGFLMTILGSTKFLNDAAGAIQEFDLLVVSATVAGCIKEQVAAPAQGSEVPQFNGVCGIAHEAANAGGGALATATSFWGTFKAPFIG